MGQTFVKKFLENVKWATPQQIEEEGWHVLGLLSNRLNERLKFDIDFKNRKYIKSNSKANKVLFEKEKEWVLIDTQEFLNYMKKNKLKQIDLNRIIKEIDWNIRLKK